MKTNIKTTDMAVQDYKINYKSDFVLTINGDAGWAVPFCIKFWTGMPSQGYFVGYDGSTYTNCRVGDDPTKLVVLFDDHHLPIGELKMQIAYHTTIEEFPGSVYDEVTNARDVIVTIDGTEYHVMLDFDGETAPELEFNLPAYAAEQQRIENELQRQQQELQREQATAAAVQGAENVNAQLNGTTLTVTDRNGVRRSVDTKGEKGEKGDTGEQGPKGDTGDTGPQGDTGEQGQKGEKGDKFTYSDFTPAEIAELQRPATEAAQVANAAAVSANAAASAANAFPSLVGYYQATINGGSVIVNAPDYKLTVGGSFRIKMPSAGTTASTLTIGNANAVQLWYNGAAVSAQNTWEAEEIISVFYDGTRFMASNSQGGGGKAEKIKYDNSQSGENVANVQEGLDKIFATKLLSEFGTDTDVIDTIEVSGTKGGVWDTYYNPSINTASAYGNYYYAPEVVDISDTIGKKVHISTNNLTYCYYVRSDGYYGKLTDIAKTTGVLGWKCFDNRDIVSLYLSWNSNLSSPIGTLVLKTTEISQRNLSDLNDDVEDVQDAVSLLLDNVDSVESALTRGKYYNGTSPGSTANSTNYYIAAPIDVSGHNGCTVKLSQTCKVNFSYIIVNGSYTVLKNNYVSADTNTFQIPDGATSLYISLNDGIQTHLTALKATFSAVTSIAKLKQQIENNTAVSAINSVTTVEFNKLFTQTGECGIPDSEKTSTATQNLLGLEKFDYDIKITKIKDLHMASGVTSINLFAATWENSAGVITHQYVIPNSGQPSEIDVSELNIVIPANHIWGLAAYPKKLYNIKNYTAKPCPTFTGQFRVGGNLTTGSYLPCVQYEYSYIGVNEENDAVNSCSKDDMKNIILYGSSLTAPGSRGLEGENWVCRLNDFTDFNLINVGMSGNNLTKNVEALINDSVFGLYPQSRPSKVNPSFIMWNNTANGTGWGVSGQNQLLAAMEETLSRGAQMLVGSEEDYASKIANYEHTFYSFATANGVPYSIITKIWRKCFPNPFPGFLNANHGGYRANSPYIIHADMLNALPIDKSVKMFRVRPTYKGGSPSITDLVFDDNLGRLKYFYAVSPGDGFGASKHIDNLDNDSYDVTGGTASGNTLIETAKMFEGTALTFNKFALVEFILENTKVTSGVFQINCSVNPTAVYVARTSNSSTTLNGTPRTQWQSVTFDYSDATISANVSYADMQRYDKVRFIIEYSGSFTLANPIFSSYNGIKKSHKEYNFQERKNGVELMTETGFPMSDSGWSLTSAEIKSFPTALKNYMYTSYSTQKSHLELPTDSAYAVKTISTDGSVSKIAVRVIACFFPKIATTRFNSDTETMESGYVANEAPQVVPYDYDYGELVVTINDNDVHRLMLLPGWSESYFETRLVDGESSIKIQIGRNCAVDSSYDVNSKPVLVHAISVQKI